ncbi:MAG: AI-2E family transporter, partial [Flavitalea sp.]
RQIFLLIVIILVAIVLFREMQTFIPAVLGAYTLYLIMRKYMFRLTGRYKWKKGWTAGLLMLISFIVIMLPILLLVNMMASKVNFAIQHSNEVLTTITTYIKKYEKQWGFEILNDSNISKLTNWGAQTLPSILDATLSTLVTILVMYFILYFMLTQAKEVETGISNWLPLNEQNAQLLRKDTNKLVLSNAIGIPLIALAQGIVGLIGYLIIGISEPWFWFAVTAITAMLPVVGAALAYIPLGLLQFANDEVSKGVIVLLFGFIIIGSVDNIFRFWLNKKLGDIHPLITIFGVIIGVNLFGFIGIIFGPILISLFLLLIKVYTNEYGGPKVESPVQTE